MRRSLTAMSLLMLPAIAVAHPGHGTTPQDASHWIEPVHSVPIALVVLAVIIAARIQIGFQARKAALQNAK